MKINLNIVGLAMKAGKCISGEEGCEKAIKSGKVKLVILSHNASPNTQKKFEDLCSFRDIPIQYTQGEQELGLAVGKPNRMVIAILDERFAMMITSEHKEDMIKHGGGIDGKN